MVAGALLLPTAAAHGWSKPTHEKMTQDALSAEAWLDRPDLARLKVTPFAEMVRDVLGGGAEVQRGAFRFRSARKRAVKREAYLRQTSAIADPSVRAFARTFLLSDQTRFAFDLGEDAAGRASARQVLSRYASEPDRGMDKHLDASWHQAIMGGTGDNTPSQGFRHMSFLLNHLGEAPKRAQLFFDLAERAIDAGHPYWGFRFAAWGLHYVEDMGTPVHTHMLPTTKFVKLRGMLRRTDDAGAKRPLKKILGDVVLAGGTINANYHNLYESYTEAVFHGRKGASEAGTLERALRGEGRPPGLLARIFAPRTMEGIARRRAWSRRATPSIARSAVRFFTERFREPAPGGPSTSVGPVNAGILEEAVATVDRRQPGESAAAMKLRLEARGVMLDRTARQFAHNGRAIRGAVRLLGRRAAYR